MESVVVKVVNRSGEILPEYQTLHAAGMDIRASIDRPLILAPMQRVLVPTGLFIELPEGYEAQIRPRSGLALKHGITVLNSPGTIDADYRGEIRILLVNLSDQPFELSSSERIAQMIVAPYTRIVWQEVDQLSDSDRGTGGYGSTGIS